MAMSAEKLMLQQVLNELQVIKEKQNHAAVPVNLSPTKAKERSNRATKTTKSITTVVFLFLHPLASIQRMNIYPFQSSVHSQ
jgi:hypothetical protein